MSFYPPISSNAIWAMDVILKKVRENSDYLDDPNCDYPAEDKALIRGMTNEGSTGKELITFDIDEEIEALFHQLKDTHAELGQGDTAEKMSYFRTATSLLDKILTARERAINIRQLNGFYSTVLRVMEDHLDVDGRTAVIEELRKATK